MSEIETSVAHHHRVSPVGQAAGAQLVLLIEPAITRLAAEGEPDERCKSCAFRAGTVPNGCAQTMMDALKCVIEDVPFHCHVNTYRDGSPKICHGWFAAAWARGDAPAGKAPWHFSPPDELIELLQSQGYTDIVQKADGKLYGLQRFNFTWGLVVDLSAEGYGHRYCYEAEADARAALAAWDGTGHPTGPWIKAKGMGTDLLNPELQA